MALWHIMCDMLRADSHSHSRHDHRHQNHCLSPLHHYLFVSFYLNTIVYTWDNDPSGHSIAVNSNTIACLFQSQGSTFGQSRVKASLVGQFISVKFLVKTVESKECSNAHLSNYLQTMRSSSRESELAGDIWNDLCFLITLECSLIPPTSKILNKNQTKNWQKY